MRLWLLFLVVACSVFEGLRPCSAAQQENSQSHPRITTDTRTKHPIQVSNLHLAEMVAPQNKQSLPESTTRITDAFSIKNRYEVHEGHTLQQVGVEPWVPGRGALGIKVEVTW